MSEQIKAGLVPHTTALTAKLDSLPVFQVPSLAANQPIEDYREQLDDLDIQLSESLLVLKSRMDNIEKWQEKWLHYIASLDDDAARTRAGNEYNTTVRGARGPIELMEEAELKVQSLNILKEKIKKVNAKLDRQQTNLSLATIAQSPPQVQIQSPPQSSQISDPTIQMAPPKLRIFDGDILMWSEWWDSFTRLVDKKQWDDGYKLDQLVNHLSGRAHKYIQGYAGDPKNYLIVKERLQKKFGDNEVILDRLHKDLTHLPKAQNASEIPKTVETIECVCRQLEAKGENLEQRHIRQMIESKFPLWFVNEMYMQRSSDWNVTKMRQYLEKWVDVREQAREAMDSNPPTYLHKNPKFQKNPNDMNTSSVMVSNNSFTDKNKKLPKYPCVFCGEKHWNNERVTYNTAQKRIERIKNLRLCYIDQNRPTDPSQQLNKSNNYPVKTTYHSGTPVKRARTEHLSNRPPPYNKPCLFCLTINEHWTSDCPHFMTIEDRQHQLVLHKKCLQCGRKGNHVCPKLTCYFCSKDHWNALCPSKYVRGQPLIQISDKTDNVNVQTLQTVEMVGNVHGDRVAPEIVAPETVAPETVAPEIDGNSSDKNMESSSESDNNNPEFDDDYFEPDYH